MGCGAHSPLVVDISITNTDAWTVNKRYVIFNKMIFFSPLLLMASVATPAGDNNKI